MLNVYEVAIIQAANQLDDLARERPLTVLEKISLQKLGACRQIYAERELRIVVKHATPR